MARNLSKGLIGLFMCWMSTVYGSSVSFIASPDKIMTGVTSSVSMRCAVTSGGASDVRHVTSIFVTRHGSDDVASVTSFDAAMALTDVNNLQAKGSLSADKGEGLLELTWSDASSVYIGDYQCKVAGVDSRGHAVSLSASLTLTAGVPSADDVLSLLSHRPKLRLASSPNTQDFNSWVASFSQKLAKLTACTSARSAVTARLTTGTQSFANNQKIVFRDILENIGNDYDAHSGTFICREPGIYLFNLHALGEKAAQACLHLEKNGQRITHVWLYRNPSDRNAASASAVLQLKAGDAITVVASCASTLMQGTDSHGNSFTAVLVQSDQCL